MSRLDDFEEILKPYDERFHRKWKDFIEGFNQKHVSLLAKIDEATKHRLVNVYQLLKEPVMIEPLAQYLTAIKLMLDKNTETNSMRAYADTVETMARSFKK